MKKLTVIFMIIISSLTFCQELIMTLEGHVDKVNSIVFSPKGGIFASGGADNLIILWDSNPGEKIKILKGHKSYINSVDIAPNAEIIASGSDDKTIKIWDINSGKLIVTLKGQDLPVNAVAFSPDGTLLVGAFSGGDKILIWDTSTWKVIRSLNTGNASVYAIAFSPDGKYLCIGDDYKEIILWDILTWKIARETTGYKYPFKSIAFSSDGEIVSIGVANNSIKLWNKETGEEIKILKGHEDIIYSIAFSPLKNIVASGSADEVIIIWDIKYGEKISSIENISSNSIAFSPTENLLVSNNGEKINIYSLSHTISKHLISDDFVEVVKREVEKRINEWQKRGKFEKSEEFKKRVNEEARKKITDEFIKEEINNQAKKYIRLDFSKAKIEYDPDNEVFNIIKGGMFNILVKVPIAEAESFDKNFNSLLLSDEQFNIDNKSQFVLVGLKITNPINNKVYTYNSNSGLAFDNSSLNLNFDPMEFDITTYESQQTPEVERNIPYSIKSDLRENIPVIKGVNSDAVAVIIGNRNYKKKDIPTVEYAIEDADIMKQYLIKAFGFREANIIYISNAAQGDFNSVFGTDKNHKGKLFNYVKEGKSDVFIFYSGHGAPDPETKQGYFVPVDCDPSTVALNGYPIKTFYDNLAKINYKSLTVVIDACFSGSSDKGMLLKNISPVFINVENPVMSKENTVVFTSAGGDQVSSWYLEKKHSLFTYYFLKALQGEGDLNQDKKLTVGEIKEYVNDNVPYMARRLNNREQTPQVTGDENKVILEY